MAAWWRAMFERGRSTMPAPQVFDQVSEVAAWRAACESLSDDALKQAARNAASLPEVAGAVSAIGERVLGLRMFDEQIAAALALARGQIVEMQTGEGKTLAAVPAVVWHARSRLGVHVLTANDYLARRDAETMREIYAWCGLSVAAVQQTTPRAERHAAYRADITYATANEVGFDYLRDGLALEEGEQVHRPFAAALVDEADSILIDEARTPLVIAGGASDEAAVAVLADRAVRGLVSGNHFSVETHARNVVLTPAGVTCIERAIGCANLFDAANLQAHTAVQDALHAHVLLHRDVDYVVVNEGVMPVDEFKGRIAPDRRWPAGLQTAIDVKEGVRRKTQGRVLGSITIEHLIAQYPLVSGMTGTAATQAEEFRDVYGLDVIVIPTHRPVARVDEPDRVFDTKAEKEAAVRHEIRRVHALGRPVLVGTSSVEESERLSRALGSLPHHVLNARNEADEAVTIARAGQQGAVTISTNMAGRGVDICLGPGVAALGGLHVLGTNRHESRRIDHQLRGRAGRQGDPGSSQFFVSREDPLIAKYAGDDPCGSPDQYQRIIEGQHLDTRRFLHKYETVIESQRQTIATRRQDLLVGRPQSSSTAERLIGLTTIDDLWSDYLSAVAELRSGTAWISLGYADPFSRYLRQVHEMFGEMQRQIATETEARLATTDTSALAARQRGATWTYLTTDEPFGEMTTRVMRELVRRWREKRGKRAWHN